MNPVSTYESGGSSAAFRLPTLRASCPVCLKASITSRFFSTVLDSVTTAILMFPFLYASWRDILALPSLSRRSVDLEWTPLTTEAVVNCSRCPACRRKVISGHDESIAAGSAAGVPS